MYEHKRLGGFDLPHEYANSVERYCSRHAELGGLDTGKITSSVLRAFNGMQDPLVSQMGNSAGDKNQQKRMGKLGASVTEIYEDFRG